MNPTIWGLQAQGFLNQVPTRAHGTETLQLKGEVTVMHQENCQLFS